MSRQQCLIGCSALAALLAAAPAFAEVGSVVFKTSSKTAGFL
jgi:hypothetical protein